VIDRVINHLRGTYGALEIGSWFASLALASLGLAVGARSLENRGHVRRGWCEAALTLASMFAVSTCGYMIYAYFRVQQAASIVASMMRGRR